MRRYVFLVLVLSLWLSRAAAAVDPQTLLNTAGEHLYKWQIEEASQFVDEALKLAQSPDDKARAYYLRSQLEFYEGNYGEAVKYAKEASAILPDDEEIGDLVEYLSQVAKTGKKFKQFKTGRFIIKYAHPKDAILVGYAEKTLERAYFEIGSDLEIYPGRPVVVEIYPDPESFAVASTLSRENIKTTGVVGVCKFNRLMILSPRLLPKGYVWLDTLAHEYTHYLLFLKGENTVPVWLHEGIAKFEEKRWKEKGRNAMSPLHETLLAKALEENNLVPMDEMYPSFGKLSSARRAQLAFAQVGTVVDFLVKKWGNDGLLRLLEGVRESGDYETAVKQVTGMNFSEFYGSWIADLKSRNLVERIPGVDVKEIRFRQDKGESDGNAELADVEDNKARDYARLGDMLKTRGRLKAAVYEYEKALNFDPVSPVILNRLAGVQTELGEYKKAEYNLSRLTGLYPDYVDTYINLGRIHLEKKNYKRAEESYRTAISINPFDPEVHAALISIYETLSMSGSAKSEKKVLDMLIKKE